MNLNDAIIHFESVVKDLSIPGKNLKPNESYLSTVFLTGNRFEALEVALEQLHRLKSLEK